MNIANKTLQHNLEWFEEYTKDLTIPKEWEEQSYKNDVCPSWVYKDYRIFINHYDKNKRTDETAKDPRFTVCLDEDYINCSGMWFYVQVDNLNEVIKLIK